MADEPVAVVESAAAVEGKAAVVCDEAHLDAVLHELQDMCVWSGNVNVVDVPMSPWGGSPPGYHADVLIAVERDQIRLLPSGHGKRVIGGGNPLGQQAPIEISDFATALAGAPLNRTNEDGERELRWSLQIAGDVPSTVVGEVLRTLSDAKMPNGHIVLQNPEGPAAVRDPILHANLEPARAKVAPEQRIGWAMQELERFAGPCLSFKDAFEAATSVDPGQACWALATGLGIAISDCRCEREAEIITVMYTTVFGAEPPKNRSTSIRARISPDATPRHGKTWGSIVAGIEKKEDLLSLWVSGDD